MFEWLVAGYILGNMFPLEEDEQINRNQGGLLEGESRGGQIYDARIDNPKGLPFFD